MVLKWWLTSSMSHAGMVGAYTHSLGGTINVFFWLKIFNEINQFLASSEMNFKFKSQLMVFSTCENVGEIFETLRQRLHRNCRARQFGHVGVTFPIGGLGVKEFGPCEPLESCEPWIMRIASCSLVLYPKWCVQSDSEVRFRLTQQKMKKIDIFSHSLLFLTLKYKFFSGTSGYRKWSKPLPSHNFNLPVCPEKTFG